MKGKWISGAATQMVSVPYIYPDTRTVVLCVCYVCLSDASREHYVHALILPSVLFSWFALCINIQGVVTLISPVGPCTAGIKIFN